jgi:hypothetical protein
MHKLNIATAGRMDLAFISRYAEAQETRCQEDIGWEEALGEAATNSLLYI